MANQRRTSKHEQDFRARRLARLAQRAGKAAATAPAAKPKGKGKPKADKPAARPPARVATNPHPAPLPPAPSVPHTPHTPPAPHAAKDVDGAFDDKSSEHLTPPEKRHWFGRKSDKE